MTQLDLLSAPEPRRGLMAPGVPDARQNHPGPTGVAGTSRDAYEVLQPVLGARQREVMRFVRLRGNRGATREEIADGTGLRIQTVCGRCAELVAIGLLYETDARRLTSSGHAAKVLKAVPSVR